MPPALSPANGGSANRRAPNRGRGGRRGFTWAPARPGGSARDEPPARWLGREDDVRPRQKGPQMPDAERRGAVLGRVVLGRPRPRKRQRARARAIGRASGRE